MGHRFSYVKYNERAQAKQEEFKKLFEAIESFADTALSSGRAKYLVMTHLEEAYMWTGKAIRDEMIEPMTSEEKMACENPSRGPA